MVAITRIQITKPSKAGKSFSLDKRGQLVSKTDGSYQAAKAFTVDVSNASELAELIEGCTPNTILLSGVSNVVGEKGTKVVPKASGSEGQLSRDDESFPHQKAPGLMVIDADGFGDPELLIGQLCDAAPALADVSCVIGSSTSSRIMRADDGEILRGDHGLHCYFLVADASDIPRALEALHKRLWLSGHGKIVISEAGKPMARSCVDLAMRTPSQPIYQRAHLGAGLVQDKLIRVFPSDFETLDTREAIPSLSAEEEAELADLIATLTDAVSDEIEAKTKAYREREIQKKVDAGLSKDEATALVSAALQHDLYAKAEICLSNGEVVTVGEILSNPDKWHGATCRDPLEWDYGSPQCAVIYSNQAKPIIKSHAHGGVIYFMNPADAPVSVDLGGFGKRSDESVGKCHNSRNEQIPPCENLASLTSTDGFQSNTDDHRNDSDFDDHDEAVLAAVMPKIDEGAFYGPLKSIVEKGTENSEATKIGIAMQVMGHVSLMLRPFCIEIGDESAGCNLYLVQVGPSAVGRKGTSSQLADKYLAPGVHGLVTEYASQFEAEMAKESELIHRKKVTEASISRLRAEIDRIQSLKPEDIQELQDQLDDLQTQRDPLDERIKSYQAKLQEVLSPATSRQYEKSLEKAIQEASVLDGEMLATRGRIKRDQEALENPEKLIDAIKENILAFGKELIVVSNALESVSKPEPWQELFCELAEGPNMMRGVTSGEGLIEIIRDDRTIIKGDGEEEIQPGNPNKRLFINLSEFGGFLSKSRQVGSSLGEKFRQLYDCQKVETGSKTSPTECNEPYASMTSSITPQELVGFLFDPKDRQASADNGVGNRSVYLWAIRDKLVSRPTRTEGVDEMVETLFTNVLTFYSELKPTSPFLSCVVPFTEDGEKAWDDIYRMIDSLTGVDTNSKKLFGRLTTNARKMAVVLAAINGQSAVDAAAVKAASHWIEYSAKTINAVSSNLKTRHEHRILTRDAEKVLGFLVKMEADKGFVSYRELSRRSNIDAGPLLRAVNYLQAQAPSPVEVIEDPNPKPGKRKATLIRLTHHYSQNP